MREWALGLMFFGVAEPIMHYADPPVGEAKTIAAISGHGLHELRHERLCAGAPAERAGRER